MLGGKQAIAEVILVIMPKSVNSTEKDTKIISQCKIPVLGRKEDRIVDM